MKKIIKEPVRDFKDLKDVMYYAAEKYNNKTAFTLKHKHNNEIKYEDISYKKFLEQINFLGTSLYAMGAKGKRIAIIGRNRYEWIISHLANLLGGIVSVPLDNELQYDELENSLIRSEAEFIIFDEKHKDNIENIIKNKKTQLKYFICMGKLEGYKSIEELIEEGKKIFNTNNDYINNEINENEMNVLLFTSGTTDKSKAVMLSQRNIASNIHALCNCEDIRETDTNIALLPFHHIFGSTCILMMLASGTRNVFADGLRYIKQNLNEYKVTVFVGVPLLIEAIYKAITKEIQKQRKEQLIDKVIKISNFLLKINIDIRRKVFKQIIDALGGELRLIVSGGAPADPKISKGFINLGISIVQGYGLTETSPVITAEDYKHVKSGTVGVPMRNNIIEIDNPDEEGIGEVKVKGPNVMLGYYKMPEKTANVLKDGWFYTGDLGFIDKDGYLTLTGRSKDMIVLKNGKKIFPEELETIINRLEIVKESMVFGIPIENDEKDLKLSVKIVYDEEVLKEKYDETSKEKLEEIIWEEIKKINKSFPNYKHIQNMILTNEELIKTTTKKIKRQEEIKKILASK